MTDLTGAADEPDRILCALSYLLSSVAAAVREHAVGGEYMASRVLALRQSVDKLAEIVDKEARHD